MCLIIYALRADAYAKRDDLDRAIEDYDRAITAVGDKPWIHALRAIALRRAGDYEGALASYDEASALAPEDADYFLAKAWLHSTVGQYQGALASYDEAVTIEPDNAIFLIARAWLLSTSPEDNVRNGPLAVIDTLAAINMESDIPPVFLDTLAAAYAPSPGGGGAPVPHTALEHRSASDRLRIGCLRPLPRRILGPSTESPRSELSPVSEGLPSLSHFVAIERPKTKR